MLGSGQPILAVEPPIVGRTGQPFSIGHQIQKREVGGLARQPVRVRHLVSKENHVQMLHDIFPRPISHEFGLEFLGSEDLENMLSHRFPAFPQAFRHIFVAVRIRAPIEKAAIKILREPIGPIARMLYCHCPVIPPVDPLPPILTNT